MGIVEFVAKILLYLFYFIMSMIGLAWKWFYDKIHGNN